jgi:hypothetical protein
LPDPHFSSNSVDVTDEVHNAGFSRPNNDFEFVNLCDVECFSDLELEESGDGCDISLTDCNHQSLTSLLASWATEYSVSKGAVGSLLKLLKPYHPELPVDSRTLLSTPRSNDIRSLACGGLVDSMCI